MKKHMRDKMLVGLSALLILLTCCFTLACAETPVIEYAPGQTVMSLAEYLEKEGETWFLTGKKAYTVQAMPQMWQHQ